MPVKLKPGFERPDTAPAGELLKLLVTDDVTTWEPPHLYVLDGPSKQFYPHRTNSPISSTLKVLGWRYGI